MILTASLQNKVVIFILKTDEDRPVSKETILADRCNHNSDFDFGLSFHRIICLHLK